MTFIIKCRVWGGVTGHREGALRDAQGQVKYFINRESAEAEAKLLRDRPRSMYQTAEFHYWVEETTH